MNDDTTAMVEPGPMYEFDGQTFTEQEMLKANAHDEAVCAWLKTAQVGDAFEGCARLS